MKNFFHFSCQLLTAILLVFSCASGTLHAQSNNNMGVGTSTPDASAILDVYSNTKGLLIPRPSTAPASPATGLMYYSTGEKLFKYWDGAWRPIGLWSLNGSAARYTAGNVETTGNFFMNNTAPTIYLQDTDHKSGMIHQNANLMHFLSGAGNNSTTWQINGSHWPLTLNMNNDEATFGGSAYFMEGNVGIGTTTPGYKLTIAGGTDGIGLDNTTSMYAKNASGTYEVFCHPRWSDNIMYMNYGAGGFNIRNNAGAATMFMTNGGNVGIGTTSPGQKLQVEGIGQFAGATQIGNVSQGFYGDGGNIALRAYNSTASDIYFQTYAGAATLMLIKNNGNVGIGISPAHKLHVAGVVGISNWTIQQNFANNDLTFTSPSGSQAAIGPNGVFYNSDRRLKENVKPLGSILPKLMKLEAQYYNMIADPKKETTIGFIAQDVEPLFPEFISAPSGSDELNSFYKMNYAGMSIIAVKAIQEQQEIIETQAKKIEAQQAEIDAIKTALAKAGIKLD